MDNYVEAPRRFQSRIKKGEIDERASYFSLSTKNLLCFANCKKPIKKARKNYNRREIFSSFLIIGDHKKIWSRAKPFLVRPHCPPPFPPFPPQSSVFQVTESVTYSIPLTEYHSVFPYTDPICKKHHYKLLRSYTRLCIPTGVPIYSGPHFPEFRIIHGISGIPRNTHWN